MKETKAIDDLVIKFEKARLHIQEPERVLFTSMPSKYLGKYDNGVIRGEEIPIETPNDLCWNTYRENYIRLFGTKQILLHKLEKMVSCHLVKQFYGQQMVLIIKKYLILLTFRNKMKCIILFKPLSVWEEREQLIQHKNLKKLLSI